jgi:hypothetical protein
LVGVIAIMLPHRCTTATVHYLADNFDISWRCGAGSCIRG